MNGPLDSCPDFVVPYHGNDMRFFVYIEVFQTRVLMLLLITMETTHDSLFVLDCMFQTRVLKSELITMATT